MEAFINGALSFLDGVVWSQTLMYLLLVVGLYFSLKSRFLQVRLIKPMVTLLFGKSSAEGISSFQAFCTALAGRVGTGNIVGTSVAILFGGPGALFWMWMLAFLGAATSYVECTLAQIYKVKIDGQYRGGPAYFIERGLGNKGYAVLFAIVMIISVGLFLPGVQSNAISSAFEFAFNTPAWITGLVVAIFLGLIIFGGIKRIAKAAEMIVPIMAVVYIVIGIIIIIANADKLGSVFGMIFSSAFGIHSVFGGIIGSAISWGVKRGIYSNEAGQGTQPHAAAAAEVSHPAKQGLVQALGVYVDTLLVCTATGLMILMTDCFNVVGADGAFLHQSANAAVMNLTGSGPEFAQAAVGTLFGAKAGAIIVSICLAFFAFTTILSYYYESESNIAYLFQNAQSSKRTALTNALRIAMMAIVFGSCLLTSDAIWNFGDIGVGATAWLTVIAIVLLQKPAFICLKDYEAQRKAGKDPVFDPDKCGIENADLWKEIIAEKYADLNK